MAALATKTSYFSRSAYCLGGNGNREVWCVGGNGKGACGIGNQETQKQLIKCAWSEKLQIRNIFAANQFTLVDDMDGNYYSAGNNIDGACTVKDSSSKHILNMTPITYFKEKNMKILQIFMHYRAD
eukprot:807781_1